MEGGILFQEDAERIRKWTYYTTGLASRPRRLALMNLLLHVIEGKVHLGDSLYEPDTGERFGVVLTNPPSGTEGRPTEHVWIYDARSNIPSITTKERPLTPEHFAKSEACYGDDPVVFGINAIEHREKTAQRCEWFRKFHISEIKERNYNLDIFWLKDESLEDAEDLPEPEDLASDALTHLEAAVDELQEALRFFGK
ncbi:MAG: N-6 DNA methylase [Chloroflexi bacterium]|nr:N-6 DNA methylase [Chloroflexota bacterium]